MISGLFDLLAATGQEIEALRQYSRVDLVSGLGFTDDQSSLFLRSAEKSLGDAGRMPLHGARLLTRADAGWPVNLLRDDVRRATPWLFVLGDPSLLALRSIGIGGSRDATARSMDIIRELIGRLVERGVVIVSGGARGIDATAHEAALETGGRTIVVLAQGIGTFRVPSPWREPISQGRLAVVSEFMPRDDWESFRAIQRNATIVQMSDSFIVAQAGATGGTVSAGNAALKMRWPLHVVRQEGFGAEVFPGNEILIRNGGHPLSVTLHQGIPDEALDAVLVSRPPASQRQALLEFF